MQLLSRVKHQNIMPCNIYIPLASNLLLPLRSSKRPIKGISLMSFKRALRYSGRSQEFGRNPSCDRMPCAL